MKKIVICLLLIISFLYSPAFAEVNFLTSTDQELYTNFVEEVRSQKTGRLRDKVDFYNVSVARASLDNCFSHKALLYIDDNELKDILQQGSSGLAASARVAIIYTGLGLINVGYQTYSQSFDNLQVTFSKPLKDYLIIKPEIIVLNWRYETRGLNDVAILANMVVQITVFQNDKQILQKIYKVNGVETTLSELKKVQKAKVIGRSSTFPETAFTKALNLIYQNNIQDLSEILN